MEARAEQKTKQSIVVVASLLDRVPNLAGLTRTCEIFGAEALVFADLTVVRDPDFAGISVTAERHLDMRVSGHPALPCPAVINFEDDEEDHFPETFSGTEFAHLSTVSSACTIGLQKRLSVNVGLDRPRIVQS